ncbi:MAG: FAD-binding oxidoreductase [Actinobacteria bacterium]|jgi:glycolate oxidase|nr:MAG: FAD-binding oxidoreductase [Actinomycetota bacterium]
MSDETKDRILSDEAYEDLESVVGPENVSREPAVLDGYAWQPTNNDHPVERWVRRPVAVALPSSTAEVQEIVRTCNRHGLRFKGFSTGWGVWNGPTYDNVLQIDLRRMNRILEIDEKNMYAVVEPYVNGAQLQAEAMKVGLNTHIIGAGPACSPLASATSGWGVGHDGNYMSYSPRNVLGVEWVLPDGEVLTLGSPGSGLDWFSGDGPGPSLRGIMRGSTGAQGSLGVFTRVALKLYDWPGPAQVETRGTVLDSDSVVPDELSFYMCIFPDRAGFLEANLKIGEAEIGYNTLRTATVMYINILAPRLFEKITRAKTLSSIFGQTMEYSLMMVLAGDTPEHLRFQTAVLKSIVADYGGIVMNMNDLTPFVSMTYLNMIRATIPALVFRMGGSFNTALSRNEAIDTQENWRDHCNLIKDKWIERGGIINDLVDNPYYVSYENNGWAHCEVVYQFDPRNEKHREALEPIFTDLTIAAADECMEPGFSSDPRVRKIMSPLAANFNRWQKKISAFLDPARASDDTLYCGEADFDLSQVDPEQRQLLAKIMEVKSWSDEGPPV